MAKVHGYGRVSTGEQAKGWSPEAQVAQIESAYRGLFEAKGYRWNRCFMDLGVIGGRPIMSRPEGKRLMESLEPGDVIVMTKVDRMFRSTRDFVNTAKDLTDRGIIVFALDVGIPFDGRDPMTEAYLTMLVLFAQLERSFISKRVRDANAEARSQGYYPHANIPYGFKVRMVKSRGGRMRQKLEPAPDERAFGRMVIELRDRDGMSWRKMETFLRDKGEIWRQKQVTKSSLLLIYQKEKALQEKEAAGAADQPKTPE